MKSLIEKAKQLKILAPAGNWESLRAAVAAGADAVFFGIGDFNMRAGAARNLAIEDLPKINEFCRSHNVETCITVNNILYDSDLETMRKVIDAVKASGCDAVIVADIAALQYANKVKIPAYISTQLSVSNIEAVRFFAQYSDRIILARELTIEQVAEIIQQIEKEQIIGPKGELVQIEIFGHGALCVAVSGRCGMSLFCNNSSANKGKCSQICRRSYKVTDTETGQELVIDNNYVMSPKDLSTIGLLDKIVEAGVTVLKIEGRGRPPEYVDTTVRCYKEALVAIIAGTYSQQKIKDWNIRLKTVFNRGLGQGMYMGRPVDEWANGSGNQATMQRIMIGRVAKYYPQAGVVEIKVTSGVTVETGEECLIIGETTGLIKCAFEDMRLDEQVYKSVKQGDLFTMKIPEKARTNDQVYVFRKVLD